ncbi:carboxymuconolactone decarboxylase family protein [Legionella sp. PATHC032]|uniref:carboxymuconolactone decarboxylase family protein n=1 Tax=Legionella sp. PATHC032 TaxID=2992039 RepID=UPI001B181C8C|nr:carboxymuconolactone decarboxylase family protein [Legionella sp. PATHC032]MCW8422301.1 carboxymuconolactone decarboxylase family protein [Legionella sp. PATHC032]HAZ7572772.1 alkyl hydroperoxide reductase [Legionella pneumophila]HBA1634853.1 alkyl hydroperoxide reductase [Legionella pneumophila]
MLENVKESIPEVAKDIRLNLIKVLNLEQSDGLSEQQILGSALAVSYSLGNEALIKELKELVHNEQIVRAAQLAASLMAMTNIYYRFVHLTEIKEIEHIPAGLRMQGMMNPGVDRVTFEILSLAVSALNGCGACVSSHARQLKEHGLSDISLARVGRIVAVIHAVHVSVRIE